MTEPRYRDAGMDDSARVADLFDRSFVATFGHLYPPRDLAAFRAGLTAEAFGKEIANPEFRIRLAEVDGIAIGFAKLGPPHLPVESPAGTWELWQLYVLPDWQGRGVADRLYDDIEAEARNRGGSHFQLSVFTDNHRARRFYERRGFKPVGRYDFMVGSHADEDIIMRKRL